MLFGTANGIPPTGGVNPINNRAAGGPREGRPSTSPASGPPGQDPGGALSPAGPAPAGWTRGVAVHESFGSVVAQVAEVKVDNGVPKGGRVVTAIDCGSQILPVANPVPYRMLAWQAAYPFNLDAGLDPASPPHALDACLVPPLAAIRRRGSGNASPAAPPTIALARELTHHQRGACPFGQ